MKRLTPNIQYLIPELLRATRHVPRPTCCTLAPPPSPSPLKGEGWVGVTHAICATIVLLAIATAGCGTTREYSPDLALAWVNGEPLTAQDLEEAFGASHQGHGALLAGQGVVREFLEKVIDKHLLLQEARRIGLDQDPEIEQAIEQLRAKRAADEFFGDEVKNKIVISKEAIVAAHGKMSYRFQARRILVESRAEAQKVLDRVKAGEDFSEIASQVSRHPTTRKGGHLGIVRWGGLDPELEDRLWALEAGQVSEPFGTEEGWNLLYAIERVSVDPPDLEKAKPYIQAVLTRRETKERSDALFHDLAARWKVQVHEAALVKFLESRDEQTLSPDVVLADAGEEKITLAQFIHRLDMDKVRHLPDTMALRAIRHLLEDDLFRILLRKEALARGYGARPEIVRELHSIRNKLAVDLLFKRVVYAKFEVTDEELKKYYGTNPQEFTVPEAAKVSLIVVEAEEEARVVLDELRNGKDFAALARKTSKDPGSAARGGEVGWVSKGRVIPELEKVIFALTEGEVGLAKTGVGSFVIRVEERKEAQLKPFGEVKDQARQLAVQKKSQEILKKWVTQLREASAIEIDDDAISRAVASYEESFRKKAGMGK